MKNRKPLKKINRHFILIQLFALLFTFDSISLKTPIYAKNPSPNFKQNNQSPNTISDPTTLAQSRTLKVYKLDGTKQCTSRRRKSAIAQASLESHLNTLNEHSISVIGEVENESVCNQLWAQMCGRDTGKAHIYTIYAFDLEKALNLGFKQWSCETN